MCDSDCIDWLKAQAAAYLADADRAARSPKTRIHEPQLRNRFRALGWAAGELDIHQHIQEDPTWTPAPDRSTQHQQLLEQMALPIP